MRIFMIAVLIIGLSLLLPQKILRFFEDPTSFAGAKESCVTDKCHSKMGMEKYVHGPVAVGDCLMCHIKTGQHKFPPVKGDEKLCYKCHPDRVDATKAVHRQVKENCSKCHDPHQSPYKYQLKKEKM